MLARSFLFAVSLSLGGLAAGCSSGDGLPHPGSTAPGKPCMDASECGCWQCTCQGVTGLPGGAQLCTGGKCPTGEEACTPVCAIVHAPLETATAVGMCPGRQKP